MILYAKSLQHPKIAHGFFTRLGGVSDGVYASLNCGYGSGDAAENVTQNRAVVMGALGVGGLCTAYQVHGTEVAELKEPWAHADAPHADAVVTSQPGVAIGVLTADCVPVLFADVDKGIIAAAHAGWKGTLAGIIPETLATLWERGARRVVAAIGPAIAMPSYEVDDAFRQRFLDADARYETSFTAARKPRHWQCDLAGIVAGQLREGGAAQVERVDGDTYADGLRFFSYRRATHKGETAYGRQISAIALV